VNHNFGRAISARRAALGLSLDQCARRLGNIPVGRLNALELGTAYPTRGEAQRLSSVLDMPLAILRDLLEMDKQGLFR
jgi:transcriptional regulator with XRE-family HTH domain